MEHESTTLNDNISVVPWQSSSTVSFTLDSTNWINWSKIFWGSPKPAIHPLDALEPPAVKPKLKSDHSPTWGEIYSGPAMVDIAGKWYPAYAVHSALRILRDADGSAVYKPLKAAGNVLAECRLGSLAAFDKAISKDKLSRREAVIRFLERKTAQHPGPLPKDHRGRTQPLVPFRSDFYGHFADDDDRRAAIAELRTAYGNGRILARGYTKWKTATLNQWLVAWYRGDLAGAYAIEAANGNPSRHHPGHPDHPETKHVIWQPAITTEVPPGECVPGYWPSPWTLDRNSAGMRPWIDNYLLAARMAHPQYLREGQRHHWVTAHMDGDVLAVNALSLRAQARAASGKSPWTDTPQHTADLDLPCLDQLDDTHPQEWPLGAIDEYLIEHDLPLSPYYQDKLQTVINHVRQVENERADAAIALRFTYAPDQPTLSGFHHKAVLVDQHQRTWIFKPAPTPEATFRPEVEHAAHQLARLWGYPLAESHLVTFDDRYGQAQRMLPVKRSLLGYHGADFATLTQTQLNDIAREHVLDWAIDNDDSHGDNITLCGSDDPDQQQIIGIDKGRAWRYFGGWKGLHPDARANSNAQLVYTAAYQAIADGHLDIKAAGKMYRAAIRQARRMQYLPDDVMRRIMTAALVNRPHYRPSSYQEPVDDAPTNAEELINQAIARKNRLAADITLLWERIYERANLGKLPSILIAPPLGENNQGHMMYSGFYDSELYDAVARTKSHGTPTFVAGTDIEDAHIILWQEHDHTGKTLTRAQFKVRPGKTLDTMVDWCERRAVDNTSAPPKLASEEWFYTRIIRAYRGLKYGYSDAAERLTLLRDYREEMHYEQRSHQAHIDAGRDDNGIHAASVEMLTLYLGHAERLLTHEGSGNKLEANDFPRYNYVCKSEPKIIVEDRCAVELLPAYRPAASLCGQPRLTDTGELKLDGTDLVSQRQGMSGNMYRITMSSGEQITLRRTYDAPLALVGQVEITIPEALPSHSLYNVELQLRRMGLTIKAATHQDLELFYWRHLAGILAERCDTRIDTVLLQDVIRPGSHTNLRAFWRATPVIGDPNELTQWRTAFSHLHHGIRDFIAARGYLPRFNHPDLHNPDRPAGRPYWERFDVPDARWQAHRMPAISYRSGPGNIIATGAALSTEERIRALAVWKPGMSSFADLSHGSSAYLFTRPNIDDGVYTVYLNPRILRRTSNYAYPDDKYGRIKDRRDHARWAFDNYFNFDSDAELMVKYGATFLDDIEILVFKTHKDRADAITRLAGFGITEIRGVPLTVRFVVVSEDGNPTPAFKHALKAAKASYHQAW